MYCPVIIREGGGEKVAEWYAGSDNFVVVFQLSNRDKVADSFSRIAISLHTLSPQTEYLHGRGRENL